MLDPALLREHLEDVRAGLRNRGLDAEAILQPFASLDAMRKALILTAEGLKRDQNAATEKVAQARKQGIDPSAVFAENKARGQQIKDL
jgi:seryl-tRNA synthetase